MWHRRLDLIQTSTGGVRVSKAVFQFNQCDDIVYSATPVEKALIQTLERRYQSDHVPDREDLRSWSDAYAGGDAEA